MVSRTFRRIACLGAMLGLGVASSPRVQGATAAPAASASVSPDHATSPAAGMSAQSRGETGRGWGTFLACAGCVVAAGMVVAGGPGAILIAVNAPGSALALLSCISACYDLAM